MQWQQSRIVCKPSWKQVKTESQGVENVSQDTWEANRWSRRKDYGCIELSEEGNLLHKEPHDKGAEAGGENTRKASRSVRPEGAKQQVTSLHFPL